MTSENQLCRTGQPGNRNGLIAGGAIVVSGVSVVVSGLSFMLQAFRNGGSIDWPMTVILAGALICTAGGFVSGRN